MVIIGCAYNGLDGLKDALEVKTSETIIDTDDILFIGNDSIKVDDVNIDIMDIKASFIRYPYDLIAPFTEDFAKREAIEFYKTLALRFDYCSINQLSETWKLRNRMYSLLEYKRNGGKVPETFMIFKNGEELRDNSMYAVKAIGNCYVSTNSPNNLFEFFRVERDGNDIASIFPAQKVSGGLLKEYLNYIDHALVQEIISGKEIRGYAIGKEFFLFERENIDSFDKSPANLKFLTSSNIKPLISKPIRLLMKKHSLNYLCFDLIIDEMERPFVIDLNPYGSLPSPDEHKECLDMLADIIIGKHDGLE